MSCISFSRMSLVKPQTPSLYHLIKRRYNQASKLGHKEIDQERAQSTAEVFKRVAEEKLHEAEQGVADKARGEAEMSTNVGETKVENVKNKFNEHEASANHRR